jgi:hypothetical protein
VFVFLISRGGLFFEKYYFKKSKKSLLPFSLEKWMRIHTARRPFSEGLE